MELHSYIAFALQRGIKAVTKLLADVSKAHSKELKTNVLKTHLFLFCFYFFRMMTLIYAQCSQVITTSSKATFQVGPSIFTAVRWGASVFPRADQSIQNLWQLRGGGALSPALWVGLTWPSLAGPAPALPISHQQQCSSHLPGRQHHSWTNRQPLAHFFLVLEPRTGLEVRQKVGRLGCHCQPTPCQHTEGALSSEIPALKCRYCTPTPLK